MFLNTLLSPPHWRFAPQYLLLPPPSFSPPTNPHSNPICRNNVRLSHFPVICFSSDGGEPRTLGRRGNPSRDYRFPSPQLGGGRMHHPPSPHSGCTSRKDVVYCNPSLVRRDFFSMLTGWLINATKGYNRGLAPFSHQISHYNCLNIDVYRIRAFNVIKI